MLATAHFIFGAALGKLLKKPILAWPAAFASHFLLDAVPHLDPHGLFGSPDGLTAPEVTMAALDTLFGIGLVLWVTKGQPLRSVMIGGAFFAMLMDLLNNVPPWNAYLRSWPPLAGISRFHYAVQGNVSPADWPLGFGTQAALLLISLWIIRSYSRTSIPLNST